jgi:hypothetical protein
MKVKGAALDPAQELVLVRLESASTITPEWRSRVKPCRYMSNGDASHEIGVAGGPDGGIGLGCVSIAVTCAPPVYESQGRIDSSFRFELWGWDLP